MGGGRGGGGSSVYREMYSGINIRKKNRSEIENSLLNIGLLY